MGFKGDKGIFMLLMVQMMMIVMTMTKMMLMTMIMIDDNAAAAAPRDICRGAGGFKSRRANLVNQAFQ